MPDFINEFMDVFQVIVFGLFSINLFSSVSIGSVLLLFLLFWVIVTNLWPRH